MLTQSEYQKRFSLLQSEISALPYPKPTVIAVSKTQPVKAIRALAQLGQIDFGENYVQEGCEKITQLRSEKLPLQWHFIGPIQGNKTAQIAQHFDWVHSLSSLSHAQRLSTQRPHTLPPLNVCVQVNTSNEGSKSGIAAAEVLSFVARIAALPALRLRGLMCLPTPLAQDHSNEAKVAAEFAQLHALQHAIREKYPHLDVLSMGMSGDWALALAHGATHIRIGSLLFGAR